MSDSAILDSPSSPSFPPSARTGPPAPDLDLPAASSAADTAASDSNGSSSSNSNNTQSLFHHITYPVSYTVQGLLRRLSADDAPTPLARALSANYNGSMTDPSTGVFHAPKRKLSPFQPPPLTPLTLAGYKESTKPGERLLSKALAEEIRLLVPPRLQLVDTWRLGYSLEQNGSSLRRLYGLVDEWRGKRGGFVLVVRDGGGGIFGAYLTDPPHPHAHYYGTGECFLWRAFRLPSLPDLSSLPPPPSADTTHAQRMTTIGSARTLKPSSSINSLNQNGNGTGTSTPERIRFKAFPYTGENDFTILCQQGFLSVGGGDGKYGLWLDDSLAKGVSSPCPTFGNEALSDEGEKFDVLGAEIWYLGS